MASDYFAVLHQPRRPWLDPDELKAKYQQLTITHHPDRRHEDNEVDFSSINEAYRVLSNPRLRLQHLLNLENHAAAVTAVPADLAEMFMRAAALVSDIDALLQKRERATNALSKSLLQTESTTLREQANQLSKQLQTLHDNAEYQLLRADHLWADKPAEVVPELTRLAQRFAYLDRWISQLTERQFQLSV